MNKCLALRNGGDKVYHCPLGDRTNYCGDRVQLEKCCSAVATGVNETSGLGGEKPISPYGNSSGTQTIGEITIRGRRRTPPN